MEYKNLDHYFKHSWNKVPPGKHRLETIAKYFPYSPLESVYSLLRKYEIKFEVESYESVVIEFPSMEKKRKQLSRKLYIK
ncbi:unnamed protein product [marine sediment metagenome]|uniref:Uncharacterized protein n=1 Tax=marine sediment metagenome TaxID=412755 RepID=X1B498_9ZZZZ